MTFWGCFCFYFKAESRFEPLLTTQYLSAAFKKCIFPHVLLECTFRDILNLFTGSLCMSPTSSPTPPHLLKPPCLLPSSHHLIRCRQTGDLWPGCALRALSNLSSRGLKFRAGTNDGGVNVWRNADGVFINHAHGRKSNQSKGADLISVMALWSSIQRAPDVCNDTQVHANTLSLAGHSHTCAHTQADVGFCKNPIRDFIFKEQSGRIGLFLA